ncbi:proline-rich receptor-like protein kinase PERK15 [Manihot esculenta]|uniref:proline-rich receptor-like protein kinase PERK15 n=1 Tax=Manihot esculenta TaxID=3983 RepID=UPI001CC6BA88|nr:proline-rich receptor-like protein kinase PERK15 [Manihot esculenta]
MPASTEFPGGQVAEHTSAEDLLKKFSYRELADATDSFSENHSLGIGDFGDVYRGSLPSGEVVAIKKLKCKQDGEQKEELENQIKDVGSVSHPNLVKLVGYCREKANRLLVLEFVPNKSLKFHLSDEKKRSELKWSTRMEIALGSARGLAYLHEQCC